MYTISEYRGDTGGRSILYEDTGDTGGRSILYQNTAGIQEVEVYYIRIQGGYRKYIHYIFRLNKIFYCFVQPEDDPYPFFNQTWLSLVKTSTMFVGELEFR